MEATRASVDISTVLCAISILAKGTSRLAREDACEEALDRRDPLRRHLRPDCSLRSNAAGFHPNHLRHLRRPGTMLRAVRLTIPFERSRARSMRCDQPTRTMTCRSCLPTVSTRWTRRCASLPRMAGATATRSCGRRRPAHTPVLSGGIAVSGWTQADAAARHLGRECAGARGLAPALGGRSAGAARAD